MGQCRAWTSDEIRYLQEKWGTASFATMANVLKRTPSAIKQKARNLKLGPFKESGDYVTVNQLHKTVCGWKWTVQKDDSWIKKRNFPVRYQQVLKRKIKVVGLDDWWEWAEKHQDFLDFSKFEKYSLGAEPDWVEAKRLKDMRSDKITKGSFFTKKEDETLKALLSQHRYTYTEISRKMGRSIPAIEKRISRLNIKDRPLKVDKYTKWTDEEVNTMMQMLAAGLSKCEISEQIGKSTKAIEAKLHRVRRGAETA